MFTSLPFTLISAANTLPGSVGPRLARVLRARGIALHAASAAQRIFADRVQLADGREIPSACTVVAIGATAGFLIPAPGLARDERGFKRIVAITSPDNVASGKLLEKMGLSFEGLIKLADDPREVKLFGIAL